MLHPFLSHLSLAGPPLSPGWNDTRPQPPSPRLVSRTPPLWRSSPAQDFALAAVSDYCVDTCNFLAFLAFSNLSKVSSLAGGHESLDLDEIFQSRATDGEGSRTGPEWSRGTIEHVGALYVHPGAF